MSAVATLCHACQAELPRLPTVRCPICADPAGGGQPCGRCQRQPPGFDTLHAAYHFDYPLSSLIHAFKYGHRLELAGPLGRLLAHAAAAAPRPDLVVPVPLHRTRLAERGFNQSLELALPLAATMGAPLDASLCVRKRNTKNQASLDRSERLRNVRHAFGVERRIDGACVAIVDDVATSGATLSELAVMLKKAGAARVDAWVLARAHHDKT